MLRFDVVDVFTDRPFAGNQLAVVQGASDLSDGQLLALAQEFGYSETTFPSHFFNGGSSGGYAVRIFTPAGEIPFAGHPTLGTAWVLREAGILTGDSAVQNCRAGEIEVRFGDDLVALNAPPRDLAECPAEIAASLLADLGLSADDLDGPAYVAGAGLSFVFLPVRDDAVVRAHASSTSPTAYGDLGVSDPVGGISVYALSRHEQHRVDVHARVFCPEVAVPEDAATGSAAAGLGMALVAAGVLGSGGHYLIRQGLEMGRPSTLHGSVTAADRVVSSISVAGGVQPIASGEIRVPPG